MYNNNISYDSNLIYDVSNDISVNISGTYLNALNNSVVVSANSNILETGILLTLNGGNIAINTNSSINAFGSELQLFNNSGLISGNSNINITGTKSNTLNNSVVVGATSNSNTTIQGTQLSLNGGNIAISAKNNISVIGAFIEAFDNDVFTSGTATVLPNGTSLFLDANSVSAVEIYKIDNFIKTEKSKNVFAIQEKELDFVVQNAQMLNLKANEKTISFDIINKEIKFILENI